MHDAELISVIVPIYRAERYLPACVDSILAQTYANFELILVDDGSPDKSGEMCDAYAEKDGRVRVIHKENGGVSSARNCAIEQSRGEYITFIDADDFVTVDYLEKLYRALTEKNADISVCNYCSGSGDSWREGRNKDWPAEVDLRDRQDALTFCLRFGNFGPTKDSLMAIVCSMLCKRACIGDLRMNPQLYIGEDQMFLTELLLRCKKCVFVSEALYYYRQVPESAVHVKYKQGYLKNNSLILAWMEDIFRPLQTKQQRRILQMRAAAICYSCFANEIRGRKENKDYRKRIKEIKKSRLYRSFKLKNVLPFYHKKARHRAILIVLLVKTGLIYLL